MGLILGFCLLMFLMLTTICCEILFCTKWNKVIKIIILTFGGLGAIGYLYAILWWADLIIKLKLMGY